MTDADSIWESKPSRLQDPSPGRMKPLVELIGDLREAREGRPQFHALGAQEGAERPWLVGGACSEGK